MPESSGPSEQSPAQRIGELRQGINSQVPHAEEILNRAGPSPQKRQVISVAGALYKQEQEYLAQSEIDPMTGLLTQNGFDRRIKVEIARAERSGDEIALLFFDLNGLGDVNNKLGHDAGDARIIAAADILSTSFRPTDLVARKGAKADEFLVALPLKDMDHLKERYEAVHQNILATNQNWDGFPITFPAGAVSLNFEDVEGSIRRADLAMYKAKERSKEIGKNVIYVDQERRTANG